VFIVGSVSALGQKGRNVRGSQIWPGNPCTKDSSSLGAYHRLDMTQSVWPMPRSKGVNDAAVMLLR